RGRRPGARGAAYVRLAGRWHAPVSRREVQRWKALEPPPLVLHPVNTPGPFVLVPDSVDGGFGPDDLELARVAFRHRDSATADVHPRLIELIYRAAVHFDAPYVTLVSGFRTTRTSSRHNQGRAADIVLP